MTILNFEYDGKNKITTFRHIDFTAIYMNTMIFLNRFQGEIARLDVLNHQPCSGSFLVSQMIFNDLSTEKVDNFLLRPTH